MLDFKERREDVGGYANITILWNSGYEVANIPSYLEPSLFSDKTKL